MKPTELLKAVTDALERSGIAFAVVGSIASSFYGESRLTNDVDILADFSEAQIGDLLARFPSDEFYVSEDAARQAIRTSGQFNIIHPTSGLKVDIMIVGTSELDQLRLNRRKRAPLPGENFETWFAAPEDVILKKLEFYREGGSDKHLRDVAGMLKISGDQIDRAYITDWAGRLGLTEIWDLIQTRLAGHQEK